MQVIILFQPEFSSQVGDDKTFDPSSPPLPPPSVKTIIRITEQPHSKCICLNLKYCFVALLMRNIRMPRALY